MVKALDCVVSSIKCFFTLLPLKRPDPGVDRTSSNSGGERCCILGRSESLISDTENFWQIDYTQLLVEL